MVPVALSAAILLAWPQAAAAQGESGNVCVRDSAGGAVCTADDGRIEALTPVTVVADWLDQIKPRIARPLQIRVEAGAGAPQAEPAKTLGRKDQLNKERPEWTDEQL